MKKKIMALCLGAILSCSAVAMAVTPDAQALSNEQEKAAAWMDVMLVKNKPVDALKMMGSEAQKEIDAAKITSTAQKMANDLGKYKGAQFVAWTRFDQADQMVYFMTFEKEPVVRCVLIFDKQGNLQNFGMNPIKQQENKAKK